jgi:hypothetical protein
MTGQRRGLCAARQAGRLPEYVGRWYTPFYGASGTDSAQELEFLKSQFQMMRQQLEQIEARIQELGKSKE